VEEVGANRDRYIRAVTQPAETGRGKSTSEGFRVLEETAQALAELEAMVNALEERPNGKAQT
jgi:hypothetical protein